MGESKRSCTPRRRARPAGAKAIRTRKTGGSPFICRPPSAYGRGTNPEQHFAVGWSACYLSAVQFVAKKKRVPFPAEARDDIEIDFILTGDSYTLQARHTVRLPGVEPALARQIAAEAHLVCPYSKATRGNSEVVTRVVTSAEVAKPTQG